MEISFNGKKALVTGAGKGIGRDTAKRLVELGAHTVVLSRTKSDLDSLKQEVPSITTIQCDLSDWDKTREIVEGIDNVDLLVNNAGVAILDKFLDAKKEDIDRIFDVNYKALFNVAQVVAKSMVTRNSGGSIVNISSVSSLVGLQDHSVYSSLKSGVDKLTKVMALELGQYKIRVNSLNPWVALTVLGARFWSDPVKADPMIARTPMGRFLEVREIVDSIMFLLSDKASMIHGVMLPIDGGLCTS